MFKTLSLDTKTVYQFGLITVGLASFIVVVLVVINSFKLINQPQPEPVVKVREQQLQTSINLIISPEEKTN